MYKGPSDSHEDFELVIDVSSDANSDMVEIGEKESDATDKTAKSQARPTVGGLTIRRSDSYRPPIAALTIARTDRLHAPKPANADTNANSETLQSAVRQESAPPIARADGQQLVEKSNHQSKKAKREAYHEHQEKLLALFKAAIKVKKKIADILAFLKDKDCAYLDFNALLKEETLIIHLIKGLSAYRKTDSDIAKEILQLIFAHAPLEKINWNVYFKEGAHAGMTVLTWFLQYTFTDNDSYWVKEAFSKMLNFKSPTTPAPDWILKLDWDAKTFTEPNSGKTGLWWILFYANKNDAFAKSLLNYLIRIDAQKELNWDAKNSFGDNDVKKDTSCLGLLAIYLIRNPEQAPPLLLSEHKIPLEKFDPKEIKWDQRVFNPKTKILNSLLNRYIELAMSDIPWAIDFIDKLLIPLPANHIDWAKITWDERITEGPFKEKTIFSLLVILAIQGKKFALKIIAELSLDRLERVPTISLDDISLMQLLNLALIERQEWALKSLTLLFKGSTPIRWQAVVWTPSLLQSFTESTIAQNFGNHFSLAIAQAPNQSLMWKDLNWEATIARGPYKDQAMLQWLIEEAIQGSSFAQKILGELNHEALDWKKINFKALCTRGEYKGRPLNVALFELSHLNMDSSSYAKKTFSSMQKVVTLSTLAWDTVNVNLILTRPPTPIPTSRPVPTPEPAPTPVMAVATPVPIPTRVPLPGAVSTSVPPPTQTQVTLISFMMMRDVSGHDNHILKLMPIQPAAWKGAYWSFKIQSGPYKDHTLWGSLLLRAAQGKVWESQVVRAALTEIAASNFSWNEVFLNTKIEDGPYHGKSLFEWLVIEAMQGELWAQYVVFNVNLSKFNWTQIDWNQKLTKGIYAGTTLLSSFIHHFLDRFSNDVHPLIHVLNQVAPAQLHFRDVFWDQKLKVRQHSILFALAKIANNSIIAQKVIESIAREGLLPHFDWNESFETDDETTSPIWHVVKSVQNKKEWANRTFEQILVQLPIEAIDWQTQYFENGNPVPSNIREILPEPYLSYVHFLLKLKQAEDLLNDNTQRSKLEKLLESLDVLALTVQNNNLNPMSLLEKFYRKMNEFSRYQQWVLNIPKHNPFYEDARFTLGNAMLERASAQRQDETELDKIVDIILDLIFSLPEEKSQALRQQLTRFLREQNPQISEENELLLNTFKYDKNTFLAFLKHMKTVVNPNPELVSTFQGEIKRAHELKLKAESENAVLQEEMKQLQGQQVSLNEQSAALHDENKTLRGENLGLLLQLEALQERAKVLEEQHQKDTEEKESLKRHADSLEKQHEKDIDEKIDAIVEATKFQSLWNVEKGKAALQQTAFIAEVEKFKKAPPTAIEPPSRSVTFAYKTQQAQQSKATEKPNEAPVRELHSLPLRKRHKPQPGGSTDNLDALL